MKHIVRSLALLFVGMTALHLSATAQEYKTDESISSQLKNNRQPGMQYASATKKTTTKKSKGFEGSSLRKQLEDGGNGVVVKKASGSAPAAKTKVSTGSHKPLPSEQTAVAPKADSSARWVMPSQGTEEPNEKGLPATEVKTPPAKAEKPATEPAKKS